MLDTTTGKHYEGRGTRIRLGSGRECEIWLESTDPVVSHFHAELTIGAAGGLVVGDSGSSGGTFLNGVRLTRPLPVRMGDQLMLGEGGPTLVLEGLGTSPQMLVARRPGRDSRRKVAWLAALVIPIVLLLGGVVYRAYWAWKGTAHP